MKNNNMTISIHDFPNQIKDVAVLGALPFDDGSMPPILTSRLEAAYQMWKLQSDLVFYLLGNHDDVKAMLDCLTEYYKIPETSIVPCTKGSTTFHAMEACVKDYKLEEVILLTSTFHQRRSEYIARKLGLKTVTFDMSIVETRENHYYDTREKLAMIKAFFQCNLMLLFRR